MRNVRVTEADRKRLESLTAPCSACGDIFGVLDMSLYVDSGAQVCDRCMRSAFELEKLVN